MAEDHVFKSWKLYNRKKKGIIFPDVDFVGVDHHHQQQIGKIEENEDE